MVPCQGPAADDLQHLRDAADLDPGPSLAGPEGQLVAVQDPPALVGGVVDARRRRTMRRWAPWRSLAAYSRRILRLALAVRSSSTMVRLARNASRAWSAMSV